jgi:hypothetical protein
MLVLEEGGENYVVRNFFVYILQQVRSSDQGRDGKDM